MILTLFAQFRFVNVPHCIAWIVGYYYNVLVNVGIGLIFVIQTFYPVLHNKDIYPTSSIVRYVYIC